MASTEDVLALLREAAELEHQLLVQYLYAAYSLKTEPEEFMVAAQPEQAARRNRRWRDEILVIAREEMGHLITVQQVIRSLGGQPHFDRDSFPISPHFYPFTFALEPLTAQSLARYLWTEKPRENEILTREVLLGPDRAEVESLVYPHQPNELGKLYKAILQGLELLKDRAFHADVSDQTDLGRWPGLGRLAIVKRIPNRATAIEAIKLIVEQGEGHLSSKEESHFHRFLSLYREFRAAAPSLGESPSRPVAIDPNTADPDEVGHDANRNRVLNRGRITAQPALRWARVFNKRYAILLANLTHALILPTVAANVFRPTPVPQRLPQSDIDLKNARLGAIPPEQIGALKPEQMERLPAAQFRALTIAQANALRPDQLEVLTPRQIGALLPETARAFSRTQVQSFSGIALDTLIRVVEGRSSNRETYDEFLSAIKAVRRNRVQLEALIRWSRDEMTLVIAPLAKYLTRLPARAEPNSPNAGAPFELDSTGPTLPDDEKTRWCAHQRLIDETRLMMKEFNDDDDPLNLRSVIANIDRGRADFIAEQITSARLAALERADRIAVRIRDESSPQSAEVANPHRRPGRKPGEPA